MKFPVFQYIVKMFHLIINLAAVVALRACKLLADAVMVLALGACTLLMLPDLWCLLLYAHRLAVEVQRWRDSGPHNTFLGKMRARLAASGLLAAPRDPLAECGVPGGEGWRHVLRLMFLPEGRLACMERQVRLAWEEHQAFTAALLLAAACLVLLALFLLGRAYAGRSPERRRHKSPEGTRGDLPPSEDGKADEGEGVPTPDAEGGEVLPEVEEVEAVPPPLEAGEYDPPEEEGQEGHFPPQEESPGGDASPQAPADPGREGVQQEVRHSLHVPPSLWEGLTGPQECFLEFLRRHHSVLIFMDAARESVHVQGTEEDVVECCCAIMALLEGWRRQHAVEEE